MHAQRAALVLLLTATLSACNTAPRRAAPVAPTAATASPAHENLNAVLWMQTAAEYEATVRGIYGAARSRLDDALADPSWSALPPSERSDGFETRPPAIIVDADETMIDNSPFQARGVRDGGGFEYGDWLAWVNERRARALPGAVEFAAHAAERGVTIYFVTNRDAPAETESTIANLRALGFPIAADASNVLLRGDARAPAREKSERRRWVGARHHVLLLLGDNLGDFMDGVAATTQVRSELMAPYAAWWGERWFMLPNPSYGSWEASLLARCKGGSAESDPVACKRLQLRQE
jgi:5'-nucleotidase (lipoprotein e(P4) family)